MKRERFRKTKYQTKVLSKELYNKWVKQYPEYKGTTYTQFSTLVKNLMQKYLEIAINTTHGVRLPFFTGDLSTRYVLVKAEDVQKSIEAGKIVNYKNFATMRKTVKVVWKIDYARKFNKFLRLLAFSPSTRMKKEANSNILKNPNMYKNSNFKK